MIMIKLALIDDRWSWCFHDSNSDVRQAQRRRHRCRSRRSEATDPDRHPDHRGPEESESGVTGSGGGHSSFHQTSSTHRQNNGGVTYACPQDTAEQAAACAQDACEQCS